MTNTRITDPEILEQRQPVILRAFSLRHGSGGQGRFRGGDGVVRSLQFRAPLVMSILSERRALAPFGLDGGQAGARGLNLLRRVADGYEVNLGGKNTVHVVPGDILTILTPGGGGFGTPTDEDDEQESCSTPNASATARPAVPRAAGSLAQYHALQQSA